jgi:hypothetical protein
MRTTLIAALLALFFAGCESNPPFVPEWVMDHPEYGRISPSDKYIESQYTEYINSRKGTTGVESDPIATRMELIERIRKKYKKDAIHTLYSVIVGQPPWENKVGYLEKIEYPTVMIYDRDMGVFDPIKLQIHYVFDLSLEEPVGFVSNSGLTMRFRRPNEIDDSKLGHFTPGVGAIYILGVCPSTGVVLSPEWIHRQLRTDIDPGRLALLKPITSREITKLHRYVRTVKDLDESFHKSVHGFIVKDDGRGDFGYRNVIPVRLVELHAKDFHKKGMDRAALRTATKKSSD